MSPTSFQMFCLNNSCEQQNKRAECVFVYFVFVFFLLFRYYFRMCVCLWFSLITQSNVRDNIFKHNKHQMCGVRTIYSYHFILFLLGLQITFRALYLLQWFHFFVCSKRTTWERKTDSIETKRIRVHSKIIFIKWKSDTLFFFCFKCL